MRVHIVLNGEKHEGASVLGVFLNTEKAIEFSLEQETRFDGDWIPCRDIQHRWTNGCDVISIEEWTVTE